MICLDAAVRSINGDRIAGAQQLAPMVMAVPRAALELRVLRQSTLDLDNGR